MNQTPPASVSTSAVPDPASRAPAIAVWDLHHRYGKREALDSVTFQVPQGGIFGVLGPNGSGKSTLFRILVTMLRPTGGRAEVMGVDVIADPATARRHLGVLFQSPGLDRMLTARENLAHHGHLHGLRGRDLGNRIEKLLADFGLADRGRDRVGSFSGGMRRRLELAKAMLHEPTLLLLDEPDTGLDPGARRDLWNCLERLTRQCGVTVALTTHLMDLAQRCDILAILNKGALAAFDRPHALTDMIGGRIVTVEPAPGQDPDDLCRRIESRFGPWAKGDAPTVVTGFIRLRRIDGAAIVADLDRQWPQQIASVTVGRPTLEDVFLQLTGESL